jgi:cobaltochelatase CobN
MDSVKFSHLIQEIDGYLCELGAAQIRDGLHILGKPPEAASLVDTLVCLTRLANDDVPGLHSSLASIFGFEHTKLAAEPGARLEKQIDRRLQELLQEISQHKLHTHADVLEALDVVAHKLYAALAEGGFQTSGINDTCKQILGNELAADSPAQKVLSFTCRELVPNLKLTTHETDAVVRALSAEFIEPGPSGAPSRGMARILPTGKNFYSVDPRNVPSQTAWSVGSILAEQVVTRFHSETNTFPENVCISMWGTSAMRTQGDDVAEVLALLGVRPVWQHTTRRVNDLELIPLDQMKHPRIDVTVRISGLFRDAFPHLISLMDNAFALAMNADEPPERNFVRKHYLEEQGESQDRKHHFRIFGSKPGTYGAGVLALIQEQNWKTDADLASAYLEWSSFAYDSQSHGVPAKEEFCRRLETAQIAVHNQDNREHDIFDSDDYLQFHGGIIAAIRNLSGNEPKKYFGDTQDTARPVVKDLKSEALKVFRSRVVNPKWIKSAQRHGYKGGLELSATVDYLFGYDATANILEDWMYEQVAQNYALDEKMQDFLRESNPWALQGICERLLEAAQRSLWEKPNPETLAQLQKTFLETELVLEKKEQPAQILEGNDVSV